MSEEELQKELEKLKDDPELQAAAEEYKKQMEFTRKLIERANRGEFSPFQFIHNLSELKLAREFKNAQKQVIKSFSQTADICFKEYLQSVDENQTNIELIISYKKMTKCADFYQKEMETAEEMIKEYLCYLHSNHLLVTLLGIDRPEEDCVDWRKLPIAWPWEK